MLSPNKQTTFETKTYLSLLRKSTITGGLAYIRIIGTHHTSVAIAKC